MTADGNGIICFGEMLLRLSATDRGALLQWPRLDAHIGGAEANVAVALARMGRPSAMVTCLPHGLLGDSALEAIRRHGVGTGGVVRGEGRMGLYFLSPGAGLRASSILYDRADSSFTRSTGGAFDWPRLLDGAGWLHLSGITPALSPTSAQLALDAVHHAKASGMKVSFDGNYRANLWNAWDSDPRAILSELVAGTDLLFGNHRDISLLLGRDFPGDGPERRRAAAEAAFEAFPSLRWIASTARRVIDSDHHHIAARLDMRDGFRVTEEAAVSGIVDRIGTGDAFAAGILHGLIAGDPDLAVATGHALAVLKHYVPGDFSLSGPADVDAFLAGERDVRR